MTDEHRAPRALLESASTSTTAGRLHELWDDVLSSQTWSEGAMVERFEAAWTARHGVGAVAFGSWTGGALAALRFAGVGAGDVVL